MENKKRLIDANVLMEHLERCIEEGKGLFRAVCMAIKCFVEQMPTVDAVEVVRCKDCKHNKDGFCVGYHAQHDIMPDDFCSYGERKEGAN